MGILSGLTVVSRDRELTLLQRAGSVRVPLRPLLRLYSLMTWSDHSTSET